MAPASFGGVGHPQGCRRVSWSLRPAALERLVHLTPDVRVSYVIARPTQQSRREGADDQARERRRGTSASASTCCGPVRSLELLSRSCRHLLRDTLLHPQFRARWSPASGALVTLPMGRIDHHRNQGAGSAGARPTGGGRDTTLPPHSAATVPPVVAPVLAAVTAPVDTVSDDGHGCDGGGGAGHRSPDDSPTCCACWTERHVSSPLPRPARPRWMRRWPGWGCGPWR